MRIYFDACSLNRLTDDQSQLRIRDEARAIELALGLVAIGRAEFLASTALRLELSRNPDQGRRLDSLKLLSFAPTLIRLNPAILNRARILEQAGYGAFDAVHLACAESAAADILLTTDDRFCKLAARRIGDPAIAVENPVDWLRKAGLS